MKSRWVREGPELIESRSIGQMGPEKPVGTIVFIGRCERFGGIRRRSLVFVSVGGRDAHANATEGLIRQVSLRCSLLVLLSPLSLPFSLSPSISPFIAINRFLHPAAARSRSLASRGGLAQGSSAGNERGAICWTDQEDIGDCIRSGVAVSVQGMDRR